MDNTQPSPNNRYDRLMDAVQRPKGSAHERIINSQ